MLRRLWNRFFGLESAALISPKTVYFTDLYEGEDGWYFSWYDDAHSKGEVRGPYLVRVLAENTKNTWLAARRRVGDLVVSV